MNPVTIAHQSIPRCNPAFDTEVLTPDGKLAFFRNNRFFSDGERKEPGRDTNMELSGCFRRRTQFYAFGFCAFPDLRAVPRGRVRDVEATVDSIRHGGTFTFAFGQSIFIREPACAVLRNVTHHSLPRRCRCSPTCAEPYHAMRSLACREYSDVTVNGQPHVICSQEQFGAKVECCFDFTPPPRDVRVLVKFFIVGVEVTAITE